jgi:hypothetical protein
VAGRGLLGIPERGVASVSVFEGLRKSLRSMWNRDPMHMIRHEAIAQQRQSVKLRVLAQQLKVSDALGIAGQNHLSRIAPLSNMVRNVDDHHTRQPSPRKKANRDDQVRIAQWLRSELAIPGSGGNNQGTSRLSPGFPPRFPTMVAEVANKFRGRLVGVRNLCCEEYCWS